MIDKWQQAAFATSGVLPTVVPARKLRAVSSRKPLQVTVMGSTPVLVTGATGFIGSHLVPALVSAGHEVHTISRRLPEETRPGVHYHAADVTDSGAVRDVVMGHDWHAVIHLAGLVSYTSADARAMHAINVAATQTLVDLVAKYSPEARFLFCSSVAAVGSNTRAEDRLLDEDAVWDPAANRVGYLRSKRLAEELVVAAAVAGRVRATVLCPSNVYGPRDGKKGSRKTQVKAANGRWPIYTRGGVNVLHVRVLIQAFLQLVDVVDKNDELWRGKRWLVVGENLTIKDMLGMCSEFGGNAKFKPWLVLPEWVLWCICFFGQMTGSRSMTLDRFAVATRFHWYDGRRARERFALDDVPARVALKESVDWMIQEGMVTRRSCARDRQQ